MYALRGCAYAALLFAPGAWSLWGFVVIMGFLVGDPAADQCADGGGLWPEASRHTQWPRLRTPARRRPEHPARGLPARPHRVVRPPFALAGLLLFGASLTSVTIRERQYSTRYQPAVSAAGGLTRGLERRWSGAGTLSRRLRGPMARMPRSGPRHPPWHERVEWPRRHGSGGTARQHARWSPCGCCHERDIMATAVSICWRAAAAVHRTPACRCG